MRAVRPKPSPAGLLASPGRHPRGLPVLVSEVSRRAGVFDYAGLAGNLALSFPVMLPSASYKGRRHPDWLFSELNSPAHLYLCLRFAGHLAMPQCKTRGRVDRYSFLVRLFHPPLQTGLSRRTCNSTAPSASAHCGSYTEPAAAGPAAISRAEWTAVLTCEYIRENSRDSCFKTLSMIWRIARSGWSAGTRCSGDK